MDIKLKAYGKVNLVLDVIRKREDGYHEVKMIMQNVGIYDTITMQTSDEDEIILTTNKEGLPTDSKNLIYKAIEMIKKEYNISSGIKAHLEKNIPVEAGMAGGSTDGAAALIGMNELFKLDISTEKLCEYGKRLGADVPYCIMGGTALSEGIGEILTELPEPPKCNVLIVKPVIGVSTKYVYENLKLDSLEKHPDVDGMIKALEEESLKGITDRMENVLETVTCTKYPLIEKIKAVMIENGAMNSLMSGSGPTVFGIFENYDDAKKALDVLDNMEEIDNCIITEFCDGKQLD